MKKITIISWIAVMFLLTVLAPAFATGLDDKAEKAEQEALVVGQAPPDFTLTDLDGNEFTLSDMAGEKAVVIDFWATWCGWCVRGFPNLVEFTDEYGDKVEVVAVDVWEREGTTLETISDFKEENDINFTLLMNWEGDVAEQYFVTGIPLTVVVDIDGNIAAIYSGYHETLKDDLVTLLDLDEL